MTPAQRYLAACTTLKNVAGVEVEEQSSEILNTGYGRSIPIRGVISLEGLERLASVLQVASRARFADLDAAPLDLRVTTEAKKLETSPKPPTPHRFGRGIKKEGG